MADAFDEIADTSTEDEIADTPTEEEIAEARDRLANEIAQHFSAMDDSVALVNATVADDTDALGVYGTAFEVGLMVLRNTDHLEIQAATDWYAASSVDKTPYSEAVTAGKAYVAV
jgi:hypothetical protein